MQAMGVLLMFFWAFYLHGIMSYWKPRKWQIQNCPCSLIPRFFSFSVTVEKLWRSPGMSLERSLTCCTQCRHWSLPRLLFPVWVLERLTVQSHSCWHANIELCTWPRHNLLETGMFTKTSLTLVVFGGTVAVGDNGQQWWLSSDMGSRWRHARSQVENSTQARLTH